MKKFRLTTFSCFVGIFVQAIITNITAILFVPLMGLYGFTYVHLGILVGVNFSAQVMSDIIFSGLIDKLGYRKLVLPACISAFIGLVLFGLTPSIFNNIFSGMLISTIIFSMASGLLEVLLSPIINAMPNEDKACAMSLMHSFYAWGQVATIIVTTVFIFLFGHKHWQIIVLIWAIVPCVNYIMFTKSHFPDIIPDEHRLNMRDIFHKAFYLFALAAILFGAATEVVMNQWASTFTEKSLNISKLVGDLGGMCIFAIMLGLGRMLYGKYGGMLKISNVLIYCSILSIICYLTVAMAPAGISLAACGICGLGASLLWPGTLVISAERYPLAGAWMFAILAAAGDIGAGVGPWLTGLVIDRSGDSFVTGYLREILNISQDQAILRTGILFAVIFPVCTLICHLVLKNMQKVKQIS
ncbi:MAG: MFS transporter [Armatimonadota bacterium]